MQTLRVVVATALAAVALVCAVLLVPPFSVVALIAGLGAMWASPYPGLYPRSDADPSGRGASFAGGAAVVGGVLGLMLVLPVS